MPNRNPTAPRRSPRLLFLRENSNPATFKSRLNDEVPSPRRSPGFSNHQKASLIEHKLDVKMREFPSRDSVRVKRIKTKENGGGEELAVEEIGVIVEEWKKEQGEGGMEGKRKYGGGGEIVEGWTKEQELALQTCFAAKPSRHFWKNVSELVPGKSKQDCFDRFHHDIRTPPRCEPRSRAKTINSSPLHQYSISPSSQTY